MEYVEIETTPAPPPHPYVFSYAAGRSPGTFDRTHSEVSDGSGVVRGTFSYVDPRQQVRTVDYVADKTGFYPVLSHPSIPQQQSEAVRKATESHNRLFNQIAEQHAVGNGGVSVVCDFKKSVCRKRKNFRVLSRRVTRRLWHMQSRNI